MTNAMIWWAFIGIVGFGLGAWPIGLIGLVGLLLAWDDKYG